MPAGIVDTYARLHTAFRDVASDDGIAPTTARLVVAVDEAGGTTSTDKLERLMRCEGAMVRRALLEARAAGLLRGGDKRGTRSPIHITTAGQLIAHRVARVLLAGRQQSADNGRAGADR